MVASRGQGLLEEGELPTFTGIMEADGTSAGRKYKAAQARGASGTGGNDAWQQR